MTAVKNIVMGLFSLLSLMPLISKGQGYNISFELYNKTFNLSIDSSIVLKGDPILSEDFVRKSYHQLNAGAFNSILDSLINYKDSHQLNDWLYYQLIRRTAEAISPKKENYERYTIYKWFLLIKSGYDAKLTIANNRIILYVYNDEDISDIPFAIFKGRKYICLNRHDYAFVDLTKIPQYRMIGVQEGNSAFTYRVTRMPDFRPADYSEKQVQFNYGHKIYHFNIKLNPDVETIFTNYPIVDFESYFNIPLSKEAYGSLIPLLKKNLKGMKQKKGVDYLMRFTRHAFLYENDKQNFGKEKRLSPEETLFSKYSDCDDRAALFFYLVKEIYDLPMLTLLYPSHITMAVQFDKPVGTPIVYDGQVYSFCEPTPQIENLSIGQISNNLKNVPYKVVYSYHPGIK